MILSALFHGHVERAGRMEVPCAACLGRGCRHCEKKGWVWVDSKDIGEEGADLFRGYAYLRNHHLLPAPGALIQQTAKFLRAADYCDAVHGAFEARKKKGALPNSRAQLKARLIERMVKANDHTHR